ncbi:alpha/beta hydrolase [Uliginosibacterium sp. 31-16]|uniref:alpha/beta hydrolase n=1 Tax=Uliginosibacterium sp. 31-16 TaxID=3068315 RepID=UPI00273F22D7|nr:alpha/beta hydrolase [Uliginosibacterium sp. 31-16]MDP5240547.1 alpha/beta hydrolase [Uliginosibacterium sp. 31-16]
MFRTTPVACLSLILAAQVVHAAEPASLPGYTEGAQVIRVTQDSGQIDAISGVIYSQLKGTRSVRQLRMALLVPRTTDLKPAIVYFPGGGFISAEHEKYIEMRMALAKAGFVVAAVEYRTVPDKFPAPLEDAKAAVRYLREHADEYGIDPARIGALGDSAGGYVAQMLGTTNGERRFDKGVFLDKSSDVQAAVTLYGISNLLNIGAGLPDNIQKVHESPAVTEALLVNGPAFARFPGATVQSVPEKALDASPMGHIAGKKPPFLIFHGSADTHVSPVQSAQLYKGLLAGGNQAEYVLVEGAGHGDLTWFQKPVIEQVVSWFQRTLGKPIKGKGPAGDANANL